MFLDTSYIGKSLTPIEIQKLVQGKIDEQAEGIEGLGRVDVGLKMILDIPEGLILVGGSYDSDTIDVDLAARNPYENISFTEEMLDWFNHEIAKTIVHEGVHRQQDQEDRFEEGLLELGQNISHRQYLGSEIEMEAYGKADIKMDIEKYGSSVQLDEYEEIFGANSEEVRIVKQYAGVE